MKLQSRQRQVLISVSVQLLKLRTDQKHRKFQLKQPPSLYLQCSLPHLLNERDSHDPKLLPIVQPEGKMSDFLTKVNDRRSDHALEEVTV
jgi:hypothetical protein